MRVTWSMLVPRLLSHFFPCTKFLVMLHYFKDWSAQLYIIYSLHGRLSLIWVAPSPVLAICCYFCIHARRPNNNPLRKPCYDATFSKPRHKCTLHACYTCSSYQPYLSMHTTYTCMLCYTLYWFLPAGSYCLHSVNTPALRCCSFAFCYSTRGFLWIRHLWILPVAFLTSFRFVTILVFKLFVGLCCSKACERVTSQCACVLCCCSTIVVQPCIKVIRRTWRTEIDVHATITFFRNTAQYRTRRW